MDIHTSLEARQCRPRGSRGFAPASWRPCAIGMGQANSSNRKLIHNEKGKMGEI